MKLNILTISLLLVLISCGSNPPSYVPPDQPSVGDSSDDTGTDHSDYDGLTRKLLDSTTLMVSVLADTAIQIAPGVVETDIRYSNSEGKAMEIFILQVDLKDPSVNVIVGTPFDKPDFSVQTVLGMAEKVSTADHQVVAGINGDYFNNSTKIPVGILIKDGEIIKDDFSDNSKVPQQGLSFFGILDGKKPVIGYKNQYTSYRNELTNATGGGEVLVMNHKIVLHPDFADRIDPRTAIGYTSDSLIYMLVVDGRNPPYSNGMKYEEMSNVMRAFNVEAALTLDGGGSSTFITRNPDTGDLETKNEPSDGDLRPVSNSWLVIINK